MVDNLWGSCYHSKKRKEVRTLEIIRVGIQIRDRGYAEALVRGLSRESRNMAFLLDETENTNLVLTDMAYPEEYKLDRYLYLVAGNEVAVDREDLIFRYEDCRSIVNRLTCLYYLLTGRNLEYQGTTVFRAISFVSGTGGAGVTSLCLSVGRMMSILYGCHCLYLSLTPLDGAGQYEGICDGRDLQKLFFRLETKQEVPLGAHIVSDGYLDRLRVPFLNHYLTEIDGTLLASLMSAVDRMGHYDFVLIDIGTMYAGGAVDLLRNSDGLVCVCDGRRLIGEDRLSKVMETLQLSVTKGIWVTNMVRERGRLDGEKIVIGFCQQAFVQKGERIEVDLNTAYGADVAMLCERIMGEYDNE